MCMAPHAGTLAIAGMMWVLVAVTQHEARKSSPVVLEQQLTTSGSSSSSTTTTTTTTTAAALTAAGAAATAAADGSPGVAFIPKPQPLSAAQVRMIAKALDPEAITHALPEGTDFNRSYKNPCKLH